MKKEKDKNMQKLFKTVAIFWEKAQCVCKIVKTAKERHFSLATPQLDEAMDQSGTLLGLMLRPTSICQDSTIRGNNQKVSNWVFSVSSYILLLGWYF